MRICKWAARGTVAFLVLGGVGVALLGTDVGSYVFSGGKCVREAVVDAVPLEFELRRAKDMIEELIPELHANIRLVAKEEVEVEALETELTDARTRVTEHQTKLTRVRDALRVELASYTIAGQRFTRTDLKRDLARRLDECRNAADLLAGKERLLENRRTALHAAQRSLAEMRTAKEQLTGQVAALESQFRLVQATGAGSEFELKTTKLAKTRKLLKNIKRRLDVAQRVLEKEQYFVDRIITDPVSDNELFEQVDMYLDGGEKPGKHSLAAQTD